MNKPLRLIFSLSLSTAALVFSVYNVARAATKIVQQGTIGYMQVLATGTPVAMPTVQASGTPEAGEAAETESPDEEEISGKNHSTEQVGSDEDNSEFDDDSQDEDSGSTMSNHHGGSESGGFHSGSSGEDDSGNGGDD
jgi:hypothetical protein